MAHAGGWEKQGSGVPRAFVVAGGRSSRMGRDKALLPWGDGDLLDHAMARLRLLTDDIRILCGPERRYEGRGAPVIQDPVCGAGPLGGLYAALLSASIDERERMIWLAVDLPLVPAPLLAGLVETLDRAEVAMAATPRGAEPLCAAFRTQPTLARVRSALFRGQLKLTSALDGLRLHTVEADEAAFMNVNTATEYAGLAARPLGGPAPPRS